MKFHTILAVDPAPTKPQPGGTESLLGSPIFLMVIIVLMMYFLLIRPQSKQRKEQAARVAAMEKGDKIVSIGGLHGVVHHISDKTVTIKLAEGVFVPFEKSAIQSVTKLRKDGGKSEPAEDPDAGHVKKP